MKPQVTRSEVPRGRRALERAAAGAAVALVAALAVGATSARAGDFEDAFEAELGRIAARNVVAFGHYLFTAPHTVHVEKRYTPYWRWQSTRSHSHWQPRTRYRPLHVHHHVHHGRPCKVTGVHSHRGERIIHLERRRDRHDHGHDHARKPRPSRRFAYRY